MDDRRYVLRRCIAAALGLSAAAPIFAQTAPSTGAGTEAEASQGSDLNEIIVTARRVEERLQDVPISITVYNQEQLTQRNVINSADLAAYTPSAACRHPG